MVPLTRTLTLVVVLAALGATPALPQSVVVLDRAPDPHGVPRPARNATHVPVRTSLYFELGVPTSATDRVSADTVEVTLRGPGGADRVLLGPGLHFSGSATGWLAPREVMQGPDKVTHAVAVYVEPGEALAHATRYEVHVRARSRAGSSLPDASGTWSFTTQAAPSNEPIALAVDMTRAPVTWKGAFFSGFCSVVSCSRAIDHAETNALMARAREAHPRAWMLKRDPWLTQNEDRKPSWAIFMDPKFMNIVRERETRRVAALEPCDQGTRLRLEDLFGHEQYGVPSNRLLSEDFHPGDRVLVADGVNTQAAKVVALDDAARTVVVDALAAPPGGWLLAYQEPAPTADDADAPGRFRAGGCTLRKLDPPGTACFFWGRLDKEWDQDVKRLRRRLVVNFTDATSHLSIDGLAWSTVKDPVQWHDAARTIAGHVIDRYGANALGFSWSLFNEPDLGTMFWRNGWDEMQRYYDYTSDAILRAFEDRGYDSSRVFVGGLELAAIFGVHLKLHEFLAHCSPVATHPGALATNAAFADKRLDGKRSRRVEALCASHGGKGAPCDFVSIHSYNRSATTAAKLVRAKEIALEIDPAYYAGLWINSHESCPDWAPPPDEAAADSYRGNGYFPSWCVDVVARQLRRAAADPRYAYGETILTAWPPARNFAGVNTFTRIVAVDDTGDGKTDRAVTIPSPIFHALNLLSDMGPHYWSSAEHQVGDDVVGAFASRDEQGRTRFAIVSHHAEDTQSRSDVEHEVALDVTGLEWTGPMLVREHRFDRDHNTYFELARSLRDRPLPADQASRMDAALVRLDAADIDGQMAAVAELEALGEGALMAALQTLMRAGDRGDAAKVREAATAAFLRAAGRARCSTAQLDLLRRASELCPTRESALARPIDGHTLLTVRVRSNGVNFVELVPAGR